MNWRIIRIYREMRSTDERFERLHLYLIRYEGWREGTGADFDWMLESDFGVSIRAGLRWIGSYADPKQRLLLDGLRHRWIEHSRLKDTASFEKVKEALAELDGKPWWEASPVLIRAKE